jgi:hypothetical protein
MRAPQPLPMTLALLLALALPLAAQERDGHPEHIDDAAAELSARNRELGVRLWRLRQRIHETNRWMIVHSTPEPFHGVGTELAHAGEHIQEMIRRMDAAYREPEFRSDPAVQQSADRLRERLGHLEREMEQTYQTLRAGIGQR